MTNAFWEETWHDQQKDNDDNNDNDNIEDNEAMMTMTLREHPERVSDPRDLWSLGHWSHLWKLRTTIIKFIATLIKSDGAAFAILAMFSLKEEGWVSWISFIDCLHIPQRSQYDVKYGVYLRPPPNLEDDYELSDLHRFAQNIGKKKISPQKGWEGGDQPVGRHRHRPHLRHQHQRHCGKGGTADKQSREPVPLPRPTSTSVQVVPSGG